MSAAAVETMDSSARPGELRTWRDAVTPLSRSSRRRWAVAYALLLVLGGVVVAGASGLSEETVGDAELPLLVALLIVFGMLRRGTLHVAATGDPLLDEREIAARDRAFRLAYPLLVAVLALTALVIVGLLPDIERPPEAFTQGGAVVESSGEAGRFLSGAALAGILLWGVLWAIYLPTGVLAWREPDSHSAGPGWSPAGLSEPLRDALVALALGGALVLAFLGVDGLLALLPLIAVLTLLGGLARREAGQRPIARTTLWALAATLAIMLVVVVLVVLLLRASSSGGSTTGGPVSTKVERRPGAQGPRALREGPARGQPVQEALTKRRSGR